MYTPTRLPLKPQYIDLVRSTEQKWINVLVLWFAFISNMMNSEHQLNQKRSYLGMEYKIIHPQNTAFIFVSFEYILYSHCLWRCVTIMGKTPYPSKDHDGQLQNESRVRSASMRTSQHKLTFLQWRAFPSGYDLLCACSLGWFVSGKQSRSSADQPRR